MHASPEEGRNAAPIPHPADDLPLANDRLKSRWESWFWSSMVAAIGIHFAVFALWPKMSVTDTTMSATAMETLDFPLDYEIPPPPEEILRPATPQMGDFEVSLDATMGETTFDANPAIDLPPPPDSVARRAGGQGPGFTPYTVAPELQNRAEVARALQREYPALLKDARIGGIVLVWLHIDADGSVLDRRVAESSGYDALDAAALKVAARMRFTGALNRDKKVPVWVAVPVEFTIGNRPQTLL